MDLQITNPPAAWNGHERENVFFATDVTGRRHGTCFLVPQILRHLYPDRPMNIYFSMEADVQARYMLFGAAMARARLLRDAEQTMQARLFTCIRPDDEVMLDFYAQAGFNCRNTENQVELQPDGMEGHPPMGCEIYQIPLNTYQEQTAFLARLYDNNITHIDLPYLSELLRNPHVCALALVNQGQCVAEAFFSGVSTDAELLAIYTVEGARRQGIATALLRQCMAVLSREGVSRFTARLLTASQPQMGLAHAFHATELEAVAVFPSYHL